MGLFTQMAILSTLTVIILSTFVLFIGDMSQNYSQAIDSESYQKIIDSQAQSQQQAVALTSDYQVSQDNNQGVNQQTSDAAQLQSLIGTQSQNKDFVSVFTGIWNNFLTVVTVNKEISAAFASLLILIVGAAIFHLWRQRYP